MASISCGRLKSLKLLALNNTGFSEAGHASLTAALPDLQIAWDGADAQRAVALRLLEKGSTLSVIDRTGQLHKALKTRESLPAGRVIVKEADLSTGLEIGDDDLKQLVVLPDIETLRLVNVPVTPVGLGHLHALATLKTIDLGTLRLPGEAVVALQKALPGCQVVSMEPADVEVARSVLAAMGRVTIVTERGLVLTDLVDAAKLPAGNYSIRAINLDDSPAATDEFLAKMNELPALESLYLSRTGITDDGVAQLGGAKSLREISLTGTKITSAGVGALSRLPGAQPLVSRSHRNRQRRGAAGREYSRSHAPVAAGSDAGRRRSGPAQAPGEVGMARCFRHAAHGRGLRPSTAIADPPRTAYRRHADHRCRPGRAD